MPETRICSLKAADKGNSVAATGEQMAAALAGSQPARRKSSPEARFHIDVAFESLNKQGEELCGDRVEIVRQDDYVLAVLADGLGSGVKANILATLTSKIVATMLKAGADLDEVVETVASTLPLRRDRQIAYSTFSIVQLYQNGQGYLIEFDNPASVLLNKNQPADLHADDRVIAGKRIRESRFALKAGDSLVLYSDGVVHAGVGKLLNMGWQRPEILAYLQRSVQKDSSAACITRLLLTTVDCLYQGEPGDDATVLTLKICPNMPVTLMVGPPVDPLQDEWAVKELLNAKGRRIVCGGTTSQIVSRVTGAPLEVSLDFPDPAIPPTGHIKGFDLVTEGIITLSHALDLMRQFADSKDMDNIIHLQRKDGASQVANILLEQATDVRFLVGRALNPAHQNPDLPLDLSLKLNVVASIAQILREQGKAVSVDYV